MPTHTGTPARRILPPLGLLFALVGCSETPRAVASETPEAAPSSWWADDDHRPVPDEEGVVVGRYGVRGPADNADPHIALRRARGEGFAPVELRVPEGLASRPAGHAPRVRMSGTTVIGRLAPDLILTLVRRQGAHVERCFDGPHLGSPSASPPAASAVTVSFTIERDGSVGEVGASSNLSPGASDCVKRTFERLTFPSPEGGTVRVTLPLGR